MKEAAIAIEEAKVEIARNANQLRLQVRTEYANAELVAVTEAFDAQLDDVKVREEEILALLQTSHNAKMDQVFLQQFCSSSLP